MKRAKDVRVWLRGNPSADELREAFPDEWAIVDRALSKVVERMDMDELASFATTITRSVPKGGSGGRDAALTAEIRRQIALRMLHRLNLSLATGVASGRLRFNLVNGWIVQRLFFTKGLTRKPVSMFWYRAVWPRLPQRRYLLPLVGPKGIYCFYSRPLIDGLRDLIGDRSAVEIAAGDGTLSRFLHDAGVDIVPTDDYSWSGRVEYDERVVKQDAVAAVRTRQPQVVICSWPPAGNPFEREVFKTRSVEMYIVIGSRHEGAAGNWATYRGQKAFDIEEDERLSGLVLPFDLDSAVFVFRRRTSSADPVIDVRTASDAVTADA